MSSESYHEPAELLSEETRNLHRAIVSLKEELEAVDWYQQRAEACTDAELRAVLLHNKNEEIEHALMTLEWLRRNDDVFRGNVEIYLNSSGPITEVEKRAEADAVNTEGERGAHRATPSASVATASTLGIGSLKGGA
jgi:uncharacterized protein